MLYFRYNSGKEMSTFETHKRRLKKSISDYRGFMDNYFATEKELGFEDFINIEKGCQDFKKAISKMSSNSDKPLFQELGEESIANISKKMYEKVKRKRENFPGMKKFIFHSKICPEEENNEFHNKYENSATRNYEIDKEHINNQYEFLNSHVPNCYQFHNNFLKK